MRTILADISSETGFTIEQLKSDRCRSALCCARQRFMAEAYATGRFSLPQIGRFIGRDHTTVLHGIRAHGRRTA